MQHSLPVASDLPNHTLASYRSLFESMTEGIAVGRLLCDASDTPYDYQIVAVNRAFEVQFGMDAAHIEGRLASEIQPDIQPPRLDLYARVASSGTAEQTEVYDAAAQRYFAVNVISPGRNWFIAAFADITDRKLREEESERLNRLYAVLRYVNQAVVRTGLRDELFAQVCRIATRVGGFLMASVGIADPAAKRVKWAASSGDSLGFFNKMEIALDKGIMGRGPTGTALREGRTYVCNDYASDSRTVPWRAAAAESGIGSCIALPIMNNGRVCAALTVYARDTECFQPKEVALLEEVADDVTFALDHMEQEAALQETTRRFRTLLDEVRLVALGLDASGAVTYANPFFFELTGYTPDEVLGMPWVENFIPERNRDEVSSVLEELLGHEKYQHFEHPILTKKGEKRLIVWNNTVLRDRFGKPEGSMSLGEDITERKLMEENLFRAQRMESIGLLAGGVAHDLNNILSPIMMSASMLHGDVPEKVRAELIENIEEAAFRGAGIVKQVLTFARGVKGERVVLKPEALIAEVWGLVRETFPKSIDSTIVAPQGLWNIVGDQTQMCQVLLNLCVNARDAMPDGGKLIVDFANCEVDDRYLTLSADAKPGRYLRFEVTDTGMGIPPENMHRIFDPFFTTKELGVGTGLGLSTVMGIVRNHGGFVTAESQVGKGTTFRVFIPATGAAAAGGRGCGQSAPIRGNGEVILLVDDEADILKIAGMVLSRHGYRIKTASNGADALACLAKHSADIKLIITDLMMPTMDGAKLVTLIRRFGFHVPVIAASGYGGEIYRDELEALGVKTILKKPFDAMSLLAATDQALHVGS